MSQPSDYPQNPPQFQQYGQQPPPHGSYPAPGYYPAAPYAKATNGMAIASMVLGILWIYWVGSILALIFGYVARNQIRERNQSGEGMAIAGIVLGWVGIGVLGLAILAGIASNL